MAVGNQTTDNQIKHFNERAVRYYNMRNNKRNIYYRNLLFTYCFGGINIRKERIRVLEPMCGYGTGKTICESVFGKGYINYEGFDASPEIINIAKKIHPDGNFQVEDIMKFATDARYDVVVVVGGVHHIPDFAPEVLSKIYSALVPNGLFINFEPTYNRTVVKVFTRAIYHFNKSFDGKSERRFSLDELNFYYQTAGFEVIKQVYPGLLAYLLWYNPQIFYFLNVGGKRFIHKIFENEKSLYTSFYGRRNSVATFSVLRKPV